MQREIWPLVKGWQQREREHGGHKFRFFEADGSVAVCGGIGPEAARRATEALIFLYQPRHMKSVGFAGALDESLRVGQVLEPRSVINAGDGSRVDTGLGEGTLVSFGAVADQQQKVRLAAAYRAQAVDMEAAAVARGAETHGLRFSATKVISDEIGFPMPPVERFVGVDGCFNEGRFTFYALSRPWMWRRLIQLGGNSRRAAHALCDHLAREMSLARVSGAGGR